MTVAAPCLHPHRKFAVCPDGTVPWRCAGCGERGTAASIEEFDRLLRSGQP